MFDRSVFVDDLSPFFLPRCRLECIAQAAAASDKHSTGTMFATWGLSAYVCLHGRQRGGEQGRVVLKLLASAL